MSQKIQKYKFDSNQTLEIEIVDLEKLTKINRDKVFIPHRTNFYHIFFFTDCHPEHNVDFKSIRVKPHSLLFLNRDSVQRFDKNETYKGKLLVFTDEFFCKSESDSRYLHKSSLFNDLHSGSTCSTTLSNDRLIYLFEAIETELAKDNDFAQSDLLKNYLHNLLLMAERSLQRSGTFVHKQSPDLDISILFKELVNDKFRSLKTVSTYAREIHVSEKRLSQATTKIFGRTPKEIMDERIILEAKRLLSYTNKSIREISFYLGFDEPTNFTKFFKKQSSKTPVEFREKFK